MFERLHTREDAFNWQLGAALKMERRMIDLLDVLIEEAQGEELKQIFRMHQGDTREHVRRIEEVFWIFGWELSDSPSPAVEAIDKEGRANFKRSGDAVVNAMVLAAAVQTEHHEIGVYESLILQARALRRDDAAALLEQNCDEERHALDKVTMLAEREALVSGHTASA